VNETRAQWPIAQMTLVNFMGGLVRRLLGVRDDSDGTEQLVDGVDEVLVCR